MVLTGSGGAGLTLEVDRLPSVTALTAAWALSLGGMQPPAQPEGEAPAVPVLLLVEPEQEPTVTLAWVRADGTRVELSGERGYATDGEREELGENVSCYVAVGGTRLTKGAGHPSGAVVRVGFYKVDAARAFFEGVAPGSSIEVTLEGVRFNQAVRAGASSVVQHLKFAREQLESCGLPGDARDQFNLAGENETLNARVRMGVDARAGVFAGEDGSVAVEVDEEGRTAALRVRFAYPLLRHMQDPWRSGLPGTFLEPVHFHVEFEAVPIDAKEVDWDRLRREREAVIEAMGAGGARGGSGDDPIDED